MLHILFSYVRTLLRVSRTERSQANHRRQATFVRSALGAQTTDTDNNSSSAESVLQPASYNATRRALLLTVAFIEPWDPSSRIELESVTYCLLCVLDATGTASDVLLL